MEREIVDNNLRDQNSKTNEFEMLRNDFSWRSVVRWNSPFAGIQIREFNIVSVLTEVTMNH